MTPIKQAKSDTDTAEFWMTMGSNIGTIKTSVCDLKQSFDSFLNKEFKDLQGKQEELESKLNGVIKTTGIIIGVSVACWTVGQIVLHMLKIL